jgi:hypothetical protein
LQDLRKKKKTWRFTKLSNFMRKMCIGLLGMLACATSIHADGFSESDREWIAAKDFPFPSGSSPEGEIPEADEPTAPTAPSEDGSYSEDSSSNPPQESEKSEKEYVPEVQNNGSMKS